MVEIMVMWYIVNGHMTKGTMHFSGNRISGMTFCTGNYDFNYNCLFPLRSFLISRGFIARRGFSPFISFNKNSLTLRKDLQVFTILLPKLQVSNG